MKSFDVYQFLPPSRKLEPLTPQNFCGNYKVHKCVPASGDEKSHSYCQFFVATCFSYWLLAIG